jgi:NADP-dependent 3-hydroxy acid dehydrogenase YdfG
LTSPGRRTCARLADLATQRFGHLDVLASVAGVTVNVPLESGELTDWDRMIDVNLRGVLHGIAAALPVFPPRGPGHFVTVASTSACKWFLGIAIPPALAYPERHPARKAPGQIRSHPIGPAVTSA